MKVRTCGLVTQNMYLMFEAFQRDSMPQSELKPKTQNRSCYRHFWQNRSQGFHLNFMKPKPFFSKENARLRTPFPPILFQKILTFTWVTETLLLSLKITRMNQGTNETTHKVMNSTFKLYSVEMIRLVPRELFCDLISLSSSNFLTALSWHVRIISKSSSYFLFAIDCFYLF